MQSGRTRVSCRLSNLLLQTYAGSAAIHPRQSPPLPFVELSGRRQEPRACNRRDFLARVTQSISTALLTERSLALAVIHVEGLTEIGELIDVGVATVAAESRTVQGREKKTRLA
jgi:hypothetical protein